MVEKHEAPRITGSTATQANRLRRRSIFASLLVVVLLSSGVVATAAQSPPPSAEATGQPVEIPRSGVSVTFPAGWRIYTTQQPGSGAYFQASNVPLEQTCTIFSTEGFSTPEAAADDDFGKPRPDIEILERAPMELPVGDAVRLFWRYAGAPRGFYDYYVAVPRGVVTVSCSGSEPPPDRWLDIVESIEALPVDAPATGSFDPRVAVPDHGFAVDFPEAWLVTAWPWSGIPGPFGGDTVLRAQTATEDGPANAECWIFDDMGLPRLSDAESIEDWLEPLVEVIEARRLAAEPVATKVALPSGTSGRVDWEWKKNGELATSAWAFSGGETSALLLCRSEEPPDDRWLSLAETFEFLPGNVVAD